MAYSAEPAGRIDSPNLLLEWGEAPWDSVLFGRPVLQIQRIEVRSSAAEADFRSFQAVRDRIEAALVSCRLPSHSLTESFFLETHDFRFIEMVFYPEISGLDVMEPDQSNGLTVRLAGTQDLPAIEDIASRAFRNERFHADPRLDSNLGDERYRRWATKSLEHPTQRLYCVLDDQLIVAFFVVEAFADGSVYWHLNAVSPEQQGKGYGLLAWRAMMQTAMRAGATMIRTCIVARNHRVLNLYARLGFRFPSPEMTFHWVREAP